MAGVLICGHIELDWEDKIHENTQVDGGEVLFVSDRRDAYEEIVKPDPSREIRSTKSVIWASKWCLAVAMEVSMLGYNLVSC